MTIRGTRRCEGACTECFKRKRKCDQQLPRCGQCARFNRICVLQVFKPAKFVHTATASQVSGHRRRQCSSNRFPGTSSDDVATYSSHVESVSCDLENAYAFNIANEDLDTHDDAESSDESNVLHDLNDSSPTRVQVSSPYVSTSMSRLMPYRGEPVVLANHRELWTAFMKLSGSIYLCWTPSSLQHKRCTADPYQAILPAMASSSRVLCYAALTFAALTSAANTDTDSAELHRAASYLGSATLKALVPSPGQRIANPKHLLHTVTSISFLILANPNSYVDLLPLGRSAAVCLIDHVARKSLNQDHMSLALMLFTFADLCSQCSTRRYVTLSDVRVHERLEGYAQEDDSITVRSFSDWIVHPLYGFSRRLVYPLMRLARQMRSIQHGGLSHVYDPHFIAEIDELETLLHEAYNNDKEVADSRISDEQDLLRINYAYHSAAQILLLTRLRGLPWTSPLVRINIQSICDNVKNIAPNSRVLIAAAFPVYIAGCEAVDLQLRDEIIQLTKRIPGYWSMYQEKYTTHLKQVWAVRDRCPGAGWVDWMEEVSKVYKETILPV